MANIVLRDRSGAPIEYPGIDTIKVNKAEGGTAEFVDSSTIPTAIENIPIELDFSNGDQTILAPEGMVVKSAIIKRPDTLIPGNIAEGVNIAGVVGSLAANGGGTVKCALGTASGSEGNNGVTHGLGILPDFIMVWQSGDPSLNGKGVCYYGVSQNAVNLGARQECAAIYMPSWQNYKKERVSKAFDGLEFRGAPVSAVTDETFCFGTSTAQPDLNRLYSWIAIGGLV